MFVVDNAAKTTLTMTKYAQSVEKKLDFVIEGKNTLHISAMESRFSNNPGD